MTKMGKIIVKSDGMASIYLPTLRYETMPYDFRGKGIRFKVPFDNYINYLQTFIVPQNRTLFLDPVFYETCLENEDYTTLKYYFLYDTALACLKEIYFCQEFGLQNFNRIEPVGLGEPKLVNQCTLGDASMRVLTVLFQRFNDINHDIARLYVNDYKRHPAMSYISEVASTAKDSLQLYDFICM